MKKYFGLVWFLLFLTVSLFWFISKGDIFLSMILNAGVVTTIITIISGHYLSRNKEIKIEEEPDKHGLLKEHYEWMNQKQ